MTDVIALATSVLALLVSVATAWLTYFHRGVVRMTAPSMVVFGYDRNSPSEVLPKVMVRCLLFSTGERGRIVEALFLRLRHAASDHMFPVWGLNADDKLERGGGLLVGKAGVVAWHHFVAQDDESGFRFQPGRYELDVVARVHGRDRPVTLWSRGLSLAETISPTRHDGSEQVWFDRHPQSDEFSARLEKRPANIQMEPTPLAGSRRPAGSRAPVIS
jgi:hypothetical protein